ncbi:hypothetical protein ABID30_002466 [Enterococcus rotai]|uniref:Uncharacterized protein n=1 Tax=Enterococcus rotai TaxID=118060 RepID=A0A0U2XCA1_9ENTE|nr:DUF6483 family protein [Enterococcus rotai]ALS36401.1 hypothetical protein ATZ35_04260 [Enterococcus rotai]
MNNYNDFISYQLKGLAQGVNKLLGQNESENTELVKEDVYTTSLSSSKKEIESYILISDFAKAEAILYNLFESEDREEVYSLGEWFFDRLMHLSDTNLAKGGLSVLDVAMKKYNFFDQNHK